MLNDAIHPHAFGYTTHYPTFLRHCIILNMKNRERILTQLGVELKLGGENNIIRLVQTPTPSPRTLGNEIIMEFALTHQLYAVVNILINIVPVSPFLLKKLLDHGFHEGCINLIRTRELSMYDMQELAAYTLMKELDIITEVLLERYQGVGLSHWRREDDPLYWAIMRSQSFIIPLLKLGLYNLGINYTLLAAKRGLSEPLQKIARIQTSKQITEAINELNQIMKAVPGIYDSTLRILQKELTARTMRSS